MKKILLVILLTATYSLSTSAVAESITLNCGGDVKLILDLEAKNIKQSYIFNGTTGTWHNYIIYDVSDGEIRAHSESFHSTEAGLYSSYMVLNRYNLHWFIADGKDWSSPEKNGVIKGGGADCKKQEKSL
jgi:hypothetical protein